jgi:hypothetical protein
MPALTADQVKALAPDPASLKAGQGLADARHWASLGANDAALWGECKGSGKEPYKTRVDLSNNGTACTCPSRKFPCKHALGLMLLAATSPAKLKKSAPPAWVVEWLEKRTTPKPAPVKKAESQATPESRQKDAAPERARTSKRAAKREKLAETGLDTLETWIKDLTKQGLAFAQSAPASFWDEQAARLVDAQLPGAARLVRELAKIPGSGPDWAEVLLLKLARLNLLVQAYRKLDTLPAATQADVRSLLGWNINQDELLASTPGFNDDWLVVAQTLDEDEKTGLRTQINWLWGQTSQKPAQIINFAFRNQPLDASLIPGLALRGELVYFPGAFPLRAVFKDKQIAPAPFLPSGFPDFSAFLDAYATALGQNPWLDVFPAVIHGLQNLPILDSQRQETLDSIPNRWLLRDSQNKVIPISTQFRSTWELFSLSGGGPLTVFGLWDGFAFLPMTAWIAGRCVRL